METPERCCSCVFIINFGHVFVYLVVSSPAVNYMPKVNKTVSEVSLVSLFLTLSKLSPIVWSFNYWLCLPFWREPLHWSFWVLY